MFDEEDLIPISALQHVLFCERQYALIHLEQLWEENRFTAEGNVLHERVDIEHHETRKEYKVEYGLAIRSLQYGIIGKADVVEFEKDDAGGIVSVVPVEFKRGKNKEEDHDRVQLCAQALCLEEMFDCAIAEGQFYYLGEHRRRSVDLSQELREKTTGLIDRIRKIAASGVTPEAVYEKRKCDRCSLFDICMPKVVDNGGKDVARYVQNQIRRNLHDEDATRKEEGECENY
ncbi:CRISPR-associated protein Cas4 [Marispirochaeta aestuarii]|uniref:CRISPR-associated protein Cas4 n=1 Tax=Marispirochaeta aestuarii TaxID=1963862 RepID=UPI002ABD591C|nr:CRISPR-associated protein Cas4 [Marispirochaeta aestuarii]